MEMEYKENEEPSVTKEEKMEEEQDPRLLARHLSKSTSELGEQNTLASRTTSFFTSIKERWSRGRSRERKRKRGELGEEESHSTDYAADNSSEHSSSVTPLTQSPRHRLTAVENITVSQDQPVPDLLVKPDPSVIAADESKRRRESALRQHSFFQLRVYLKRGKDLIARDKSGTSDPYVKFKVQGRLLFKSKIIYRDLNPVWDENFVIPIEDPFIPVHLKVFDYDWGLQDDFMGSAYLDLTKLELGKSTDIVLSLQDPGKSDYLGELYLSVTLCPRSQEDKEQYFQRNCKISDINRRLKSQIWSSVVTIALIEAKNLPPLNGDEFCDPYVKFRLGNEKYKSKVANKTLNPSWLEQFDLHLYDDQSQELDVTIWDKEKSKEDFIGRCVIDLSMLEREKTHRIKQPLDECSGHIFLLLTISGTTASETISDLTSYDENPKEKQLLESRYSLLRTLENLKDVGHLTVRVYRAQGLASADLGGKSDPFCVLELVNSRLQTQTEYKTLCPSWQKIFTFNIKDITSVLEVTVYDEDRDHKVEFLGKIAIPLLRIRNNEKRWYALKDKKLFGRAKGNCPQIFLELSVVWNPIRACIRIINPKEEKFMRPEIKFKRQVFVRNVMRLKTIVMWFYDISKYIEGLFEWDSTFQSIIAFVMFVLLCYYFEPYMLPAAMLLIFLKCYIVQKVTGTWGHNDEDDEPLGDEEEDEDDKDKEEKKSLKERLQAIQEVTQIVQNSIGYIATLGESITNTFNFTVPFLTYLAVIILIGITIVLYFVPVRYLILIWGVNKFARKLIRPHTIPNNEILDLISRVPDNEDLISFRELRTQSTSEGERRRDQRKKIKIT
ncbi:multiple C2 and transmembrane domain-containing protein isoform X2 [Cimex lectularius]|uniref:C2 domain-containing protein n=1 Tax=Cimex lectularius TaxID=79782 RepID=A0A8I6RHA9_CIMLE|nr:multiple C2 and transmembrane domain-containing protein isoform X2 [Cimex lectularius]